MRLRPLSKRAAANLVPRKLTQRRYPGTQQDFNNDATPRYDANAARLAWERNKNLR